MLAFDLRGTGGSGNTFFTPCTTRTLAEDVLALIAHVGWGNNVGQSRLHIVGWSMGGMIAQELALIALQRRADIEITSLTLSHSSPGGVLVPWLSRERFVPRLSALCRILSILISLRPSSRIDGSLKIHHAPLRPAPELRRAYAMRSPFDAIILLYLRTLFSHSWAVATHYVSDASLHAIRDSRIAVLVLWSRDDPLVPAAASEYLARLLVSAQHCFAAAGHVAHSQSPLEYAHILWNHMSQANPSGSVNATMLHPVQNLSSRLLSTTFWFGAICISGAAVAWFAAVMSTLVFWLVVFPPLWLIVIPVAAVALVVRAVLRLTLSKAADMLTPLVTPRASGY